tara:strand:+ start:6269 stop:6589 length:321 start_codon:yes stop_codon:yes gene_type:complete
MIKTFSSEQIEKMVRCPGCSTVGIRRIYSGLYVEYAECGNNVCDWKQGEKPFLYLNPIPGGYISNLARYESTTLTHEVSTYEPTKNHLGKPVGAGVFLIDYLEAIV